MLRDLLVQLNSYPEPTPVWAIDGAAALAETFDARLSTVLCHVHIPPMSNFLADRLVRAGEAIAEENAKSRAHSVRLIESFARVPEQRKGEQYVVDCGPTGTSRELAEHARLHDLTIVPVYEGGETRWVAESLIFEAGRPVLLLPEHGAAGHLFDTVVMGWDGSRAAARALADALPWLTRAKSVRVVAITGEKPVEARRHFGKLERHLALHGVTAKCVEEPGADAGSALLRYCGKVGAELLVMGAYGHSRIRDFVLGGATRTVIANPSLPVLLSH